MTTTSRRPVARLSTPGDVVATVPALCGFVPQDSVVLLSLRGPRRRLGLTVRLDLPPPGHLDVVAAALAAHVVQDGGAAAALVLYAPHPQPEVAAAVATALAARDVALVESLHVSGDRWTSYVCTASCCPPDGTPVPGVPALVAAEHALEGRAVLGSRAELVASLAPPAEDAYRALVRRARQSAPASLGLVRTVLEEVASGGCVDAMTAAQVAVVLHDVQVRDEVLTWALDDTDALLSLAEQVARLVGPPHDAPVCTVLAWTAYARGDGARANVALERALRADPGYGLALLLQAALDGAVPPAELRRTLRAAARR
jgi:hypothetical protein